MDQETLYNILTGAYGPLFDSIEMWACINALGVQPHKEDGKWFFAIYNSYCQKEIVGYGKTIYEAASNFYKEICGQKS